MRPRPAGFVPRTVALLDDIERRLALHIENIRHLDSAGYRRRLPSGGYCWQPGVIEWTQRAFDVAITGEGFFKLKRHDGTSAYTRHGHLLLDASGRLTAPSGEPIATGFVIPQNTIAIGIGEDGTVSVSTTDAPDGPRDLGRLTLTRFPNPDGLRAISPTTFVATAAAGESIEGNPGENGLGEVQQNFLERSNVERTPELVAIHELTQRWRWISQVVGVDAGVQLDPPGIAKFELERSLTDAAVERR
ncbi:MAG: hypothetical protein H6832_09205 [Planctomycetes bacterium]|nr:hypothetical protein [Planctomycetota bacterium]